MYLTITYDTKIDALSRNLIELLQAKTHGVICFLSDTVLGISFSVQHIVIKSHIQYIFAILLKFKKSIFKNRKNVFHSTSKKNFLYLRYSNFRLSDL